VIDLGWPVTVSLLPDLSLERLFTCGVLWSDHFRDALGPSESLFSSYLSLTGTTSPHVVVSAAVYLGKMPGCR
jgi:hypothetical protein